jgi:hypothetical protein
VASDGADGAVPEGEAPSLAGFSRSVLDPKIVWIVDFFGDRVVFHAVSHKYEYRDGVGVDSERTRCGITVLEPMPAFQQSDDGGRRRRGAILPARSARKLGAKPCSRCWRDRKPLYEHAVPEHWLKKYA